MVNDSHVATTLLYSDPSPPTIPANESPPEIVIVENNDRETAEQLVLEYVEDLQQAILTEIGNVDQGISSKDKKEYSRLSSVSKAIDTIIDNKEELSNSMRLEFDKMEQSDIESLCYTAYDVLFKKINELFDKFQFPFIPMFSCFGTSQLPVLAMTKPKRDMITKQVVYELGDAKAIIEEIDKARGTLLTLRPSACKLFDLFLAKLTIQNSAKSKKKFLNPSVTVTYDEYAQFRGLELTKSNINNLRAELKQDSEVLLHLGLKLERGGKLRNVSAGCDFPKGGVKYIFSSEIAPYITRYLMQYPQKLIELDSRNKSLYALGRKLAEHYTLDSNRLNGTYNIISVHTLLKTCIDIPSYEQVQKGNRNVTDRIIQPLGQKLNALCDYGYYWRFCNSKRAPLTDEQKEMLSDGDYLTFEHLYITFEIFGVPDQTERLEKKAEERKAIAEKKAEKEKAANSKKQTSRGRPKRKNTHDSDTS